MLESLIGYAKLLLLQGLVSGISTLVKGALAFTWAHPFLAGYVFFSLFILLFLAYGTLSRMWFDGTFASLRMSHRVLLAVFLIVPFIFGFLFDVFVMRCVYGWIRFGIPPWAFGGRWVFSPEWTFSRLIWMLKDTNAEALWWHEILHAIDPRGH